MAITNQTSSTSMVIENPAMLKLKNADKKIEEVDSVIKPETSPLSPLTVKPATPVTVWTLFNIVAELLVHLRYVHQMLFLGPQEAD